MTPDRKPTGDSAPTTHASQAPPNRDSARQPDESAGPVRGANDVAGRRSGESAAATTAEPDGRSGGSGTDAEPADDSGAGRAKRLVDRLVALSDKDFGSAAHSPQATARIGVWLGIAFGICFVTGLLSHFVQRGPGWFYWPSAPVNLYRVTQGLHVLSGIAAVPLLFAKLWSVYPKLFGRPLEDHLDARVVACAVDDAEDLRRLALAHRVALTQIEVDHDAHGQALRRLR